jgi:hypothetical protein
MEQVRTDSLRLDGGTQPRASISEEIVAEYAAAMKDGANFPAVTVFFDGVDRWLADGFHRVHAARKAGLAEIAADVRQGTRRDAVLFSVGANAGHGLQRSNDDKRRAVMTLLTDDEWSRWPQKMIAKACCVCREFVCNLSAALSASCGRSQDGVRVVTRGGTTYPMDTLGISRRRSGPLGPTGSSVVTKEQYESGAEGSDPTEPAKSASPARPARKAAGVSPDAFRPVRGHSNPPPMVPLSLPLHNPTMAANTLIELFDGQWLAALVQHIAEHLNAPQPKEGDAQ